MYTLFPIRPWQSNKQVQHSGGTLHQNSGALLSGIRDSKTSLMLSYKHLQLKQRVFTVAMHTGLTQWNLKAFLISHIMGQLRIHAMRIMMIDLLRWNLNITKGQGKNHLLSQGLHYIEVCYYRVYTVHHSSHWIIGP